MAKNEKSTKRDGDVSKVIDMNEPNISQTKRKQRIDLIKRIAEERKTVLDRLSKT